MLKSILVASQLFLSGLLFAQYGWINTFGDQNFDLGYAGVADNNGNLYVAGRINGNVNFAPDQTGFSTTTTADNGYLVKYDSTGTAIWSKTWHCDQTSFIYTACTDGTNIYVCGYAENQTDLDPGSGTMLTPIDTSLLFVSKFDGNGNHLWSNSYPLINTVAVPRFIEYAGNGRLKVSGLFTGSFDADSGPNTAMLSNNTDNSIFIIDLDISGNFNWARQIGTGTSGNIDINGFAANNSGDVVVTGYFFIDTDFDPGPGNSTITASGSNDFYLLKLDANGDFAWVKTEANGIGTDVIIDYNGDIIVGGTFSDVFDFSFGNGTQNRTPVDAKDGFLLKTDSNGDFTWVKLFYGNGDQVPKCLSIKSDNGINCAGRFNYELNINEGPYSFSSTTTDNTDVFYCRLDENGNFSGTNLLEGSGQSVIFATSVSPQGLEYIVGHYFGTEDLNTNSEVTEFTSNGPLNNYDAYVIRLGQLDYTSLEETNLPSMAIYPNPASNQLMVAEKESSLFEITDQTGRVISTGTVSGNGIDISRLANGSYVLKIGNEAARFIKN